MDCAWPVWEDVVMASRPSVKESLLAHCGGKHHYSHLLRSDWSAADVLALCVKLVKVLHHADDCVNRKIIELTSEGRHHVSIRHHYVVAWIQNRISNIRLWVFKLLARSNERGVCLTTVVEFSIAARTTGRAVRLHGRAPLVVAGRLLNGTIENDKNRKREEQQ